MAHPVCAQFEAFSHFIPKPAWTERQLHDSGKFVVRAWIDTQAGRNNGDWSASLAKLWTCFDVLERWPNP